MTSNPYPILCPQETTNTAKTYVDIFLKLSKKYHIYETYRLVTMLS